MPLADSGRRVLMSKQEIPTLLASGTNGGSGSTTVIWRTTGNAGVRVYSLADPAPPRLLARFTIALVPWSSSAAASGVARAHALARTYGHT